MPCRHILKAKPSPAAFPQRGQPISILSRLSALASRVKSALIGVEQRTRGEKVMARLSASPGGIGGYGGGGWTNNRYEQVKHFSGWQFIAIDSIAKKIACQRPGVYRVHQFAEPQKRLKCLAGPYRRKAMADLQPHEDLEPLPPEYPLNQLFANPNPPDTSYDLWYETILYLLLTGNSYWWLPKNGLGKPAEIWCLPAHWVWPIFDETSDLVAYELRPLFGSVGTCRLSADEVVHFKFKNPMSKVDGYSPLAAIANWIDVAESIDKARYHTFDNSGNPGMIALLDDETVDPTDDEIRQFESRLEHKFRGVTKTGRITALTGVKELKPYSTTPAEMAYVESDDQARDKVLAGFRVSKVLAGIATEVNRASMDGALAGFCEFTVNPLLFQLGCTITEKVATRFDPRLRVSWMDCTPDDPAQKLAEQTADVAAGATTPNEIRRDRGKEPYAYGGDDPLVSTSLAPMPMNSAPEADTFDWASIVKPGQGDGKKDGAGDEEEDSEDGGKPPAAGSREEADGEGEEEAAEPDWFEASMAGKRWKPRHKEQSRGQPDNAGQFGPGGGGKKPKPDKPNSKEPAEKPGKKTSARVPEKEPSEKAQRAKAAHHMIDRKVQRYAEEHNEPRFAKAIGGVSFPDGEAMDIAIPGPSGSVAHGVELKTMVDNKANKITMKRSAMDRKLEWEKKQKAVLHTVVIDDHHVFEAHGKVDDLDIGHESYAGSHDESKRRLFYRRGVGSFRVNGMHEVKDMAELKALMAMPNKKLPRAAQRTDGGTKALATNRVFA